MLPHTHQAWLPSALTELDTNVFLSHFLWVMHDFGLTKFEYSSWRERLFLLQKEELLAVQKEEVYLWQWRVLFWLWFGTCTLSYLFSKVWAYVKATDYGHTAFYAGSVLPETAYLLIAFWFGASTPGLSASARSLPWCTALCWVAHNKARKHNVHMWVWLYKQEVQWSALYSNLMSPADAFESCRLRQTKKVWVCWNWAGFWNKLIQVVRVWLYVPYTWSVCCTRSRLSCSGGSG